MYMRRFDDKLRQFFGAETQIIAFEYTALVSPEIARHPVFKDFATRRKQERTMVGRARDIYETFFIAAGAMQEEQRASAGTRHKIIRKSCQALSHTREVVLSAARALSLRDVPRTANAG